MEAARRRAALVARHVCGATAVAEPTNGPTGVEGVAPGAVSTGLAAVLPEHITDATWEVYRSATSPRALLDYYVDDPLVQTTHESFEAGLRRHAHEECLGTRAPPPGSQPYVWHTFAQVAETRAQLGSALRGRGIAKGEAVGVYMANRLEWVTTELACASFGMVSVPLYDTLGADVVEYICNHAELKAVVCSQAELPKLLPVLPRCGGVKLVVVAPDHPLGSDKALPVSPSVPLVHYSAMLAEGALTPREFTPPCAEDVATVCYTSGTTGLPKGAVITHRNLVSNAASCERRMIGGKAGPPMGFRDTHISYLPLAHIYERLAMVSNLHRGVRVGFFRGDMLLLLEDIAELRPTVFSSVPRLYNRIYDAVLQQVREGGALKQRLFAMALASNRTAYKANRRPNPLWERLVFKKIKDKLGGRVRIMTTGASPISDEVLDFLRAAFSCEVVEGYGMTEGGVMSCSAPDDTEGGNVGPPAVVNEIKLVSVPEMNYSTSDRPFPRGEVCVRGPSVFKGYLKDEAKTREAIDEEGWLHTGDVGTWLPGGRLKIVDRKKNIFKLAQGEYVAPEKLEGVYSRSPLVAQCFVHGDSLQPSLVSICVPDPDAMAAWAERAGVAGTPLHELCGREDVRQAVLGSMREQAARAKLQGFEMVKAVHLDAEPWTVDNELLTPTMKLKRPQAKKRYQAQIAAMYNRIS